MSENNFDIPPWAGFAATPGLGASTGDAKGGSNVDAGTRNHFPLRMCASHLSPAPPHFYNILLNSHFSMVCDMVDDSCMPERTRFTFPLTYTPRAHLATPARARARARARTAPNTASSAPKGLLGALVSTFSVIVMG